MPGLGRVGDEERRGGAGPAVTSECWHGVLLMKTCARGCLRCDDGERVGRGLKLLARDEPPKPDEWYTGGQEKAGDETGRYDGALVSEFKTEERGTVTRKNNEK